MFKFTVGDQPLFVSRLGRVYNTQWDAIQAGCRLQILRADTKAIVAQTELKNLGSWLSGFYYAPMHDGPIRLDPGATYYLLATDLGTNYAIKDESTTATAGPGLRLLGAARADGGTSADPTRWQFTDLPAGNGVFGPVSFLYTTGTTPRQQEVIPDPIEGAQAAVVRGEGALSVSVSFPHDGVYALLFNGATTKRGGDINIRVDGASANVSNQNNYATSEGNLTLGGWGRNPQDFKEVWGSGVFKVSTGLHVISIHVKTPDYVIFDNLRLTSVNALMESGFGGGSALGQPVEKDWVGSQRDDTALCRSFGLQRVSYETGWSVGGDFTQKPIQNWCKYFDPRAKTINDGAYHQFKAAGAYMPVWGVYLYAPFEDLDHYDAYPLAQSVLQAADALPAEADNGTAVPAVLDNTNTVYWSLMDTNQNTWANLELPGVWRSWVIVCPTLGDYVVSLTTAPGGKVELEADGVPLAPVADSGGPLVEHVHLTKGTHGIRVRCCAGKVRINRLMVAPAPATG